MKKLLTLICLASFVLAGCTAEEPKMIDEKSEQQVEQPNTPEEEPKVDDEILTEESNNLMIMRPLTQAEFDKYIQGKFWTCSAKNCEWVHDDGSITPPMEISGFHSGAYAFYCSDGKWTRYFIQAYDPDEVNSHPSWPSAKFTYDLSYDPATGKMTMTNPITKKSEVWFEIEWLAEGELAMKYYMLWPVEEGYTRIFYHEASQEILDKISKYDDVGKWY